MADAFDFANAFSVRKKGILKVA